MKRVLLIVLVCIAFLLCLAAIFVAIEIIVDNAPHWVSIAMMFAALAYVLQKITKCLIEKIV